jgi:hypothetical protein
VVVHGQNKELVKLELDPTVKCDITQHLIRQTPAFQEAKKLKVTYRDRTIDPDDFLFRDVNLEEPLVFEVYATYEDTFLPVELTV